MALRWLANGWLVDGVLVATDVGLLRLAAI